MLKPSYCGRISLAVAISAVMLTSTVAPAAATDQPQESPSSSESAQPSQGSEAEDSADADDDQSLPDDENDSIAVDADQSPSPEEELEDELIDDPDEAESPTPTTDPGTQSNADGGLGAAEEDDDVAQQEEFQTEQLDQDPYREITDDTLFYEDFSEETLGEDGLPEGWLVGDGDWSVEDGRLIGTSTGEQSRILFGEHHDHYRIETTLRFDDADNDARWAGLGLDMNPEGTVPWQQAPVRVGSSAANGVEFAYRTQAESWDVSDAAAAPRDVGVGEEVTIAVEVSGNRGAYYFDDKLLMETNQLRRSPDGVMGLLVNGATASFDEVLVTEIDPLPIFDLVEPGEIPAVVAHRGDSSVAPENTMAAVTSAVEGGSDFFEIDIDFTADGEIVAIHDDTVDRTTDGTGAIREMTYPEVSELDTGSWFDPAYSHSDMPLLDEVFEYMSQTGAQVVLEYKSTWEPEDVAMSTALIEEYGVEDQIIAQSFDLTTMSSLQQELPEVPRMVLGDITEDAIGIAEELGAVGYNPPVAQVLENPDWVQEANDAGLATFVWTANDSADWASLISLGVEGVITDHPGQLIGWSQRYAAGDPESGEVPAIVGHRGNSAVAPENTLPAVVSSVLTGAEYFEIDIEYTADGEIVALHDATVDRTTDGTGTIREMTYDQVSELDAGSWFAGGYGYSGVPVPKLEDVLADMADSGAHLLLEYKETWTEDMVAASAQLIEEYGVADQIVTQSFDLVTMDRLQQELPDVPRMVLGAPQEDSAEIAEELGAIAWNPSVAQVLDNPDWVEEIQAAGLYTFVYTVNNAGQWEQLTELGVDGIITDYPDHLQGWRTRFAEVVDQPEPTFPLLPEEGDEGQPTEEPTEEPPGGTDPAGDAANEPTDSPDPSQDPSQDTDPGDAESSLPQEMDENDAAATPPLGGSNSDGPPTGDATGPLPQTGANATLFAILASALLLVIGGVLVFLHRRKRVGTTL